MDLNITERKPKPRMRLVPSGRLCTGCAAYGDGAVPLPLRSGLCATQMCMPCKVWVIVPEESSTP